MINTANAFEMYTEQEVADHLEISVARLHQLLDKHIFNQGTRRPADLTFTKSEVVLLGFWHRSQPRGTLVRMPKRY
ncbi:MAG: hypothetical protein ABSD20_19075 [Terriglobales bacterium]|jgi:hypothetical protein